MKLRISFIICLFSIFFICQSCALLTAAGITSQGQPTKNVPKELSSMSTKKSFIDHTAWSELLSKHVNNEGFVDYKGFQKDKEELNKYLMYLSSKNPKSEWPVQELLAFYINIYNAYTVDLILENYPVKSIKDIKGAWTKAIVPIGNRNLSLGGIENGVLRKMHEPRIHFAINCASISCPKLLNEAYTAENIDDQLKKVTFDFINSDKNEISATNPRVSHIFKWYKKDYKIHENESVIEFINQYAKTKINKDAQLQYLDYDWNLNEQ